MSETGANRCPNCGRRIAEHPTMEGVREGSTVFICPTEDRAAKWQRVEPGHVIPAGQPYRVEYDPSWSTKATAVEMLGNDVDWKISEIDSKTFIDSSWKPPLVLPTEACVIRAKVTSWDHPRILFGHPNPGEPEGMTFCRAVDGLSYKRDEIESFEVLWVDDPEGRA